MYSVWTGSKVRDIDLRQFADPTLGSRRTYAIYHSLSSPAGNPLHMDSRMVEFGQIDVTCPAVVEVHPIDSGPFCKGVPTVDCILYRGVFDGLSQVNAEVGLRTPLSPVVEVCPFLYSNRQLASNGVKPVIVTAFLHLVHLIERQWGSRHASQKHLITGEIRWTTLLFKLRQRDVLDLHVAAILIGDTILGFGLIERTSTTLGAC